LTASYHSRPDKPVLRNVNLVFQPAETIYIVGRTGSGKSTLLSILLRLIEIGEGSVEIDGQGLFLMHRPNSLD
jgi:ABC-type multidrug transport system fused ATPase/permease subunit